MMTAAALIYNPPRPRFPWVIFLVAFASVAAGLVLGEHAARHRMADTVRNCPDDKIGLILLNPMTGRRAILCEYAPGQWGRLIEENGEEVTAYAHPSRATMNMFDGCVKALYRGGYNHVQFIRQDLVNVVVKILAVLR